MNNLRNFRRHAVSIAISATMLSAAATAQTALDPVYVSDETFATAATAAHALHLRPGTEFHGKHLDISTAGANAMGILAGRDTALVLRDSTVRTKGDWTSGIRVENGATATITDTLIDMSGDHVEGAVTAVNAASVTLNRATVRNNGDFGVALTASAGSVIEVNDSRVHASGEISHGLLLKNAAALLKNSQVRVDGEGAAGAVVFDGTLRIDGGSLEAVQGAAFEVAGSEGGTGSRIDLRNGAHVSGGNGVLLWANNDASPIELRMDGNAYAEGDIVGRSTQVELHNGAHWKGATAGGVDRLRLDGGSQWTVTQSSSIGALSLDRGTVAFAAPVDGRFATLTVNGDFVSDGGVLQMNAVLGDDGSAHDKLHVKGNTAGHGGVAVRNVGGRGAQTVDGIRLIQVDGRSDANFELNGRAVGGAYEYFLAKGGKTDPNDGDWYLRSSLPTESVPPTERPVEEVPASIGGEASEPAKESVAADNGRDADAIAPVARTGAPVLRPEAGVYLANQAAMAHLFDHTMRDRDGYAGQSGQSGQRDGDDARGSAWARVAGKDAKQKDGSGQLDVAGRDAVLQIGTDLAHWSQGGSGRVGVMAATGQSNNSATSRLTGYSASGKVDGNAIGIYGSWFADPRRSTGLYLDGWLQYGRFDSSVSGSGLDEEAYSARTFTTSVEAGYAWEIGRTDSTSYFVEPQLQVLYTDLRADPFAERNGTLVEPGGGSGLSTRVGVHLHGRAAEPGGLQPFATFNWLHDERGNEVVFDDEGLVGGTPPDLFEAKAGVSIAWDSGWSGWGAIGVQSGADDYRSYSAQFGVGYRW